MADSTRTHRPRPLRPSPSDRAFLRSFGITFIGLLATTSALVGLTDPFAVLGTGIVPPIVSADRDYKASLYRSMRPRPEVVLLGSSRIKTVRPECVTALTGRPAFNFGVNAGVAEDYLAIFRLMRSTPGFQVRQILLGAEPEAFIGDAAARGLTQSRALAPFVSHGRTDPDRLWSDLLSQSSLAAALRSAWHYGFDRDALPQEALHPDGLQVRPLWDEQIRAGRFPQQSIVLNTSRAIRARYLPSTRLSPDRIAQLHQLLREALDAGVLVTAFLPPVHPALTRAAAGTPLQHVTEELVRVLRAAQKEGMLQYVETRSLQRFSGDSTLYYDAIHMTAGNADRLLALIYRTQARCVVQ